MTQNLAEIWKDIIGYEGWYQVSNRGRVKSLDRNVTFTGTKNDPNKVATHLYKSKVLSPQISKGFMYPTVVLKKNTHRKAFTVHRLVALFKSVWIILEYRVTLFGLP